MDGLAMVYRKSTNVYRSLPAQSGVSSFIVRQDALMVTTPWHICLADIQDRADDGQVIRPMSASQLFVVADRFRTWPALSLEELMLEAGFSLLIVPPYLAG